MDSLYTHTLCMIGGVVGDDESVSFGDIVVSDYAETGKVVCRKGVDVGALSTGGGFLRIAYSPFGRDFMWVNVGDAHFEVKATLSVEDVALLDTQLNIYELQHSVTFTDAVHDAKVYSRVRKLRADIAEVLGE